MATSESTATNSENDTTSSSSTSVGSFFRNQALFGRYRLPSFIALLTAIVWALQPVVIFYALDSGEGAKIQNALAVDWIIHFLVPFSIWVYFWVAFSLIAYLMGRRMRMGRLFKLTGWGMAPFVLVGLARTVGKYYTFQGADFPIPVVRGRFESEWEGYQALVAEAAGDPTLVGATAVSCAFLLLSGYIWTYAIKYSTDLENRKKILTIVSIPTLIYAAYSMYTVL